MTGDTCKFPLCFQDQESLDAMIKSSIQPVIVITNNLYDMDIMYVVGEGNIICDITTVKICDAIVILLAAYYFYSIDVKSRKNAFSFFEMVLMGNVPDKSPVSVSTFINVLTNIV